MIGAVVGGLFAVLTQTLANRAQRKRDRQTERQALLAILQAIQAEADFHFNFPLPAQQICRIHRLPIALKPLQSPRTAQRKPFLHRVFGVYDRTFDNWIYYHNIVCSLLFFIPFV